MIVAAALLAVASEARAQCPFGQQPPCAQNRVVHIDPSRVAVLPFRVASTDTLLGEGFAELLATEFTGEGVPRAVDMGTVLQAWRRSGGGTRRSLTRAQAIELGKSVGAGLIVDGAIVGLGQRITITASLIEVPNGASRGVGARVTASADSLERANQRVAAQLLGTAAAGDVEQVKPTEPEAMRAYLRGLRAWRRGLLQGAAKEFDAAIAIDSGFAPAVYRRYLAGTWGIETSITRDDVWRIRSGLSVQDRTVVTADLGPSYPAQRTTQQHILDLEDALTKYPESAQLLYELGDNWLHWGALISRDEQLGKAREYFLRAVGIDPQATVLSHLFVLAALQRDSTLMRHVATATRRNGFGGWWATSWIAAAYVGDKAWLAELRRLTPDDVQAQEATTIGSLSLMAPPAVLVEEMFRRWTHARLQGKVSRDLNLPLFYAARGRPLAARNAWKDVTGIALNVGDFFRMALALTDGDVGGLDLPSVLRRLDAVTASGPWLERFAACSGRVLRVRAGDTAAELDSCRADFPLTPWAAALIRMTRDSARVTSDSLERAEYGLRVLLDAGTIPGGYERYLLARAWEQIGRPDRAYQALRTYRVFALTVETPWTLDYEAALAEKTGNVSAAIDALQEYVDLMKDSESSFAPRVSAARAQLARLRQRR